MDPPFRQRPIPQPLAQPVVTTPTPVAAMPQPLATQPATEPRRRRRWPWFALGALAAIAGVVWLLRYLNSPAEGVAISTSQVKVSGDTKPKPITWVGMDGRYMGFSYPDNLSARVSGETGSLESYLFYANDRGGWQLAVEAVKGTVASSSAVRYRQLHPDKYVQSSLSAGGINFVIFQKPTNSTDGSEQTAFAEKGGIMASLALTDPGGGDHAADFDRLIHSLKFK